MPALGSWGLPVYAMLIVQLLQPSGNPSSCLPWKLGMNLPLAGLVVLCYSAGVESCAEGNWEVEKLALNICFLYCLATRQSWLGRRSLPSALLLPGLPQQHTDSVFSRDVLENCLQSPFEGDLCSFLCVLAALKWLLKLFFPSLPLSDWHFQLLLVSEFLCWFWY